MGTNRPVGRHLILVKHALPIVVPGSPPAQWSLSDEGRASCTTLAAHLRRYYPAQIAASDEPKAAETAQLLAAALGHTSPVRHDHDLREHERRPEDFFDSTTAFHAALRRFFAQPDALVFGQETATAAGTRFAAAIARQLAAAPGGNLIAVAHGTVISLFAAAHAGLAPFPLWQSLGLPSYVILSLPHLRHIETRATIG
ncbi:MAG: histidine phosphatase family protein [Thermomicrobiales bacterium]